MQIAIGRIAGIVVFVLVLALSLAVTACADRSEMALLRDVSNLVRNQHYDPGLHGLDWAEIQSRYEQQVLEAETLDQSVRLIDRMMQELGDSHCGLVKLSDTKRASSPYLFAEGTPGIDARILGRRFVVTHVESGSPADQAGIRPGYELVAVDDQTIEQVVDATVVRPPYTDANRKFFQTEALLWRLFGPVGTSVNLTYRDAGGSTWVKSLRRIQRTGLIELSPSLPPIALDVQQHTLHGGVGYLTFNAFQPDHPSEILAAISKLDPSQPLIIDLRGNNGGSVNATVEILAHFSDRRFLAFHKVGREEETAFFVTPVAPRRASRTVILVDEMSVSAAENFAAVMQIQGLAKVVGTPTPGQLLWGESFSLEDDVMAIIPVAELMHPGHARIEGRGIVPDREVQLNRADLLQGVDSQLHAAMEWLQRDG